ncbi:glycosyltransferase family 1 protein [Phreatobacter sp.]|uniref:glycosyltransferase family 1 protein n=1 Tax=Phreatobacter sp. TaxID=1966341 RepID=UPI0022C0007F|nr:glycosyltransferase family 1 protein [Phreatobacter sp.]MCZ8314727.1 glycosyltransferase family 1 protein [Phreatobacter sp.]
MSRPDAPARLDVLVSETAAPCGVEAFARRLAATAGDRAATRPLGTEPPAEAGVLVLNLPVVAWKKRLVEPITAAGRARAAGRPVLIVLHEWADLDWKRRASYAPLLPLASAILFSSPEVAAQFAASPQSRLAPKRRGIVPIPPNVILPEHLPETELSRLMAAERHRGRLVLGHFGSIYPRKQSAQILDLTATLVQRGADPFAIFLGSFVKGQDDVEGDFRARARALGVEDRIHVSGYIADDADLFAAFAEVDVFAYLFAEGLTSRRGSVLACAMSGRPVVVNAPETAGAFDHHPTYRRLLDEGRLRLVPTHAGLHEVAEAIEAAAAAPRSPGQLDVESAWRDALAALDAVLAA